METTANALDAGLLRFSDGGYIGTGGMIETPNQRLNIAHRLAIRGPDDLAEVPIPTEDGSVLALKDVADVKIDHQPLIGDAVINGGDGLMLIVEKLPWANTLDVTEGVEEAMAEMQPGLRPIEVDTTIFRPATFVGSRSTTCPRRCSSARCSWSSCSRCSCSPGAARSISLITIPLSLTASALVLYWRGTTINTMVLAGFAIALGAVVDDAIVDTENIVRRLRQHRREGGSRSTARVIFDASLEVRGAVVYASLIEALALLPVFFLTGLTGAFFRPLAMSYALAVLVSMLVALVTTPALSLILLGRSRLGTRESPVGGMGAAGVRVAARPVGPPALGVVRRGGGSCSFSGLLAVPRLGQELLPEFKERDFLMHWVTKSDTSNEEQVRISVAAAKELQAIPGVRNFGSHIGQALLADEPYGVHFGENWISVDESADYDKTLAAVQDVVDGYPGLRRDVQTYLKERIREVLTGSSESIVVKIFGDDLATLRTTADDVKDLMGSVPGVIEENVELQEEVPQVEITTDLEAAERYGLKPGDVRRAAATWVTGEEVGDIFRAGKAYDVQVWSTPETRNSLTAIRKLPIDTPDGGPRRPRRGGRGGDQAAAQLHPPRGRVPLHRDRRQRGRSRARIRRRGHRGQARGDEAPARLPGRAVRRVQGAPGVGPAADPLRQPGRPRHLLPADHLVPQHPARRALLPEPAHGAHRRSDRGLPVRRQDHLAGSLVGFFTILGIVARNGIMQISHFQHLEHEEGEPFGVDLVLRGARERVTPILMTALTTGLALVPLLVTGNIPGQEIEHPMAIVIVGGLVAATILNLFVVPVLYLRFGRRRSGPPAARSPALREIAQGDGSGRATTKAAPVG